MPALSVLVSITITVSRGGFVDIRLCWCQAVLASITITVSRVMETKVSNGFSCDGATVGNGFSCNDVQVNSVFSCDVKQVRGTSLGGVPRGLKMLKGHLPRVIYHQVY